MAERRDEDSVKEVTATKPDVLVKAILKEEEQRKRRLSKQQKKLKGKTKSKPLKQNPQFFLSPQYPTDLSESLTEDKINLKLNASLRTAGMQLIDTKDESLPSDVRAPTYIPDPRKCEAGSCVFAQHKNRFEDTRLAHHHSHVVEVSLMDDMQLAIDDKAPFISTAARSQALHWSPRFLNCGPLLTEKQLEDNCTKTVPGHDPDPAAKQVLRASPIVGFTKAKRFMTRSDPRSYLAHTSGGTSAPNRTHTDPGVSATPVGHFSTKSDTRKLYNFSVMPGSASPGPLHNYKVNTNAMSQSIAAPAFTFPGLLRFGASKKKDEAQSNESKESKKWSRKKLIQINFSPTAERFRSPADKPTLESMFDEKNQ